MTDSNVNSKWDSNETSSSLLMRAKQEDGRAWQRIVVCYGPLVYRWCRAVGLPPEAARDVGQDVFLAAFRSLQGFQPRREVGSFRAWLRAITKSKIYDHFRTRPAERCAPGGSAAKQRMEQVALPPDDDDSVRTDLKLLYREVVRYIETQFSEKHCDAFFRVTMQGESPAEVATRLGISRNAVYLACARIRKRVREEFDDLLGNEASW